MYPSQGQQHNPRGNSSSQQQQFQYNRREPFAQSYNSDFQVQESAADGKFNYSTYPGSSSAKPPPVQRPNSYDSWSSGTHPTYRRPDANWQDSIQQYDRPESSRLSTSHPWIGSTSLSEAPWQQPYLWQEDSDPNNPNARPVVLDPAPEGYQRQCDHSNTFPRYYAPDLPVMYGPERPSNPQDWRQNQCSPFIDASYYPIEHDWDKMTDYEKQTYVEQQKRDEFINKLHRDVGDLIVERQFEYVPNFNRLEDRDKFAAFLFGASWDNPSGNFSLRPNFKDKWSTQYIKYHLNP